MLSKILFAGILVFISSIPVYSAEYATPPIFLKADQVLSPEQLKGKNFHADSQVRNDGLINFYTIETDYGTLIAESTAELNLRIDELNALVAMEELSRTEVFKESLVGGVKGIGKGVVGLVTSPIETTKGVVSGTGQFLSNIGESFVSDDPNQDNALKVALGYDVAKRQYAFEFGIDPYTEYVPVRDRLGEISRAGVAGGITPKVALASIGHVAATAAQLSGTMYGLQQLVRDNPPNKLRDINFEKLRAMEVPEDLANAFLDNYSYDPYEKTLLVGELETVKVSGRQAFISRAVLASDLSTALYFRTMAQMMGRYYRNVEPVKALLDTAGVLNLQQKNGGRIVLAPVDDVFWTSKLEAKVSAVEKALTADPSVNGKELWVTGRVDQVARTELEKLGWKIVENANSKLLKK